MTVELQEHAEISAYCPIFQEGVELIGRRWTGSIVRSLLAGSTRFGEILSQVPGLSDRLLSERLRELEAAHIVTRTVYPEVPVRIVLDAMGTDEAPKSEVAGAVQALRELEGDFELVLIVAAHLALSLVHGATHQRAHVPLTFAATLFVFAVILAGPVVGLVVMQLAPRAGQWLIALTLAGAFGFGVINHFLLPGADHVSHVSGDARLWFAVTAGLLAITEAAGCALAVLLAKTPVAAR